MATKNKKSHHTRKLKTSKFSRRHLSVFILIFSVIGGAAIYLGFAASLPAPSVYLNPDSQNVNNGDTLKLDVWEDSGSDSVNDVQVNLSYPTDKLSYQSFTNSSDWPGAAQSPGGDTGTLNFNRFVSCSSTCPATSGAKLVVSVTFKVIGSGSTANVTFASGTAIYNATTHQAESPLSTDTGLYTIATVSGGGGGSGGGSGGGGGSTGGGGTTTPTPTPTPTKHTSTSTPVSTPAPSNSTSQPAATTPSTPTTAENSSAATTASGQTKSKVQLKAVIMGLIGAVGLAAIGFGVMRFSEWLNNRSGISHQVFNVPQTSGGPAPIILNPRVISSAPTVKPSPVAKAAPAVKSAQASSPEPTQTGSSGKVIAPSNTKK